MNKYFISLMLSFFMTSCAYLNSVSMTSIPANRNKKVSTEKSRWIIFFLNFDNDFIDSAVDDLKSQCPGGKVTGLLTKDESISYFLFVHKRVIKANGYCLTYKK